MIDAKTRLVALLGHPVKHSMSPAMHNAAFREKGLNLAYLAFDVTDLELAAKAMRELNFLGYSVTIPHKQGIMQYLDKIDNLASKIGAVNTVVNRGGKLFGYNTDALAAAAALKAKTSLEGKKVALVGSGGAGRAIAFALHKEKALVSIIDLDAEKAKALAEIVGCSHISPKDILGLNADIIVNATPVGMHPKVDAMPVNKSVLKKGMIIFDIVYNPIETKLLKEAKAAGCKTIAGIEMFTGQGIAQFELWTGQEAPKELMKKIVEKELAK